MILTSLNVGDCEDIIFVHYSGIIAINSLDEKPFSCYVLDAFPRFGFEPIIFWSVSFKKNSNYPDHSSQTEIVLSNLHVTE